ncbi:TPA: hypothetical protein N0F65_003277 [Lagenidium giganteum]|uniref:Uncharacterized protein n=1 Tax=Lagenidium giganteum TaxID=4803 RepID=A0AAV2YHB0_9STRA|nr:TPA: hypothetical protein N0F65_003277 [Lagenidium giganteum]
MCALLRSVSKPRRTQWLPNERKPGTSKHLRERQRQEHGVHSVPLARFVEEFYVAAAMATAQADGQNR